MCVLGIAAGVALSVAARVQTTSLTGGQQDLERALVGRASLEAAALGTGGMSQSAYDAVKQIPDVTAVAPLSIADVAIEGPRGRTGLLLVGVDRRLRAVGSRVARRIDDVRGPSSVGLYLPSRLAKRIGAGPGDRVTVLGPAGPRSTLVSAVFRRLGDHEVGDAAVGFAPLGLAWQVSGQPGRLQRLLISVRSPAPSTRRAIERAVGPGARLRAPGSESRLFAQASQLYRRTADLFAAVCLVLGGILVYMVALLAAVDRRRDVSILACLGASPARLLVLLTCEAVIVGAAGGAIGVLSGWGLVHALGPLATDQLAVAFSLGGELRLEAMTAGVGLVGGVVLALFATLAASAGLVSEPPAGPLSRSADEHGEARNDFRGTGLTGLALLAAGVGLSLVAPTLGLVSVCLVAAGAVALVPDALRIVLRTIARASPPPGGAGLVGVAELRSAPRRGAAMAAIVAVMVLGVVTVGSATANLERGVDDLAIDTFGFADLWVTAEGSDPYLTRPIDPRIREVARAQPEVSLALTHRGAFLDWADRRVFAFTVESFDVTAPGEAPFPELGVRERRLVSDGAGLLISRELADAHRVGKGDRVTIPTPSGPRTLRVAGFAPNFAWQPGAIALAPKAFARWWRGTSMTAVPVLLRPGADRGVARQRLRSAVRSLGATVARPRELRAAEIATARAGLVPLRRIASMLALFAVVALAVSLIAAILQRARRVATLRAIGMQAHHALASLAAESATVAVAGAAVGLAGGLLDHALVVAYLRRATDFPAAYAIEPSVILLAIAVATAACALVPIMSLPALSVVRVRNTPNDAA